MDQVPETHDPKTFVEYFSHLYLDVVINETYISLVSNNTWDHVPLLKGRKFVRCKWVNQTKYASYRSVERLNVSLFAKFFS